MRYKIWSASDLEHAAGRDIRWTAGGEGPFTIPGGVADDFRLESVSGWSAGGEGPITKIPGGVADDFRLESVSGWSAGGEGPITKIRGGVADDFRLEQRVEQADGTAHDAPPYRFQYLGGQ